MTTHPFPMNIRPFDMAKDYEEVCAWWKGHKWQPIPLDHLSSLGLIVESGGKKLACAWLYFTGTAFAWFEFLITNPEISPRQSAAAIANLVERALEIAKASGAKSVVTLTNNPALKRLYEKGGYLPLENDITQMIARIG